MKTEPCGDVQQTFIRNETEICGKALLMYGALRLNAMMLACEK